MRVNCAGTGRPGVSCADGSARERSRRGQTGWKVREKRDGAEGWQAGGGGRVRGVDDGAGIHMAGKSALRGAILALGRGGRAGAAIRRLGKDMRREMRERGDCEGGFSGVWRGGQPKVERFIPCWLRKMGQKQLLFSFFSGTGMVYCKHEAERSG